MKKKIFFNGLNELRAFAAIAVIIHHIELFKLRDNFGSIYNYSLTNYVIKHIGKSGVILFFVLSGFLITFLLLQEKEKHGRILFKKFFFRRIFRIWPLYYLIFFISFFILPIIATNFEIFTHSPYYYNLITNPENYNIRSFFLYVLFVPNLAVAIGDLIPGASQSWSIGVEEQFYIIWPILMAFFSKKRIVYAMAFLFLFLVLIAAFYTSFISKALSIIPFEYMCVGGFGGYFYFKNKDDILKLSHKKSLHFINVLLIVIFLSVQIFPLYFQKLILSFLFLFQILFTINDHNSSALRSSIFSFLGKISYGIYMYHPIVLFLVFSVVNKYVKEKAHILTYNLLIYIFVFGLTFLLSHLSYKYIETYFIKIKDEKFKSL